MSKVTSDSTLMAMLATLIWYYCLIVLQHLNSYHSLTTITKQFADIDSSSFPMAWWLCCVLMHIFHQDLKYLSFTLDRSCHNMKSMRFKSEWSGQQPAINSQFKMIQFTRGYTILQLLWYHYVIIMHKMQNEKKENFICVVSKEMKESRKWLPDR